MGTDPRDQRSKVKRGHEAVAKGLRPRSRPPPLEGPPAGSRSSQPCRAGARGTCAGPAVLAARRLIPRGARSAAAPRSSSAPRPGTGRPRGPGTATAASKPRSRLGAPAGAPPPPRSPPGGLAASVSAGGGARPAAGAGPGLPLPSEPLAAARRRHRRRHRCCLFSSAASGGGEGRKEEGREEGRSLSVRSGTFRTQPPLPARPRRAEPAVRSGTRSPRPRKAGQRPAPLPPVAPACGESVTANVGLGRRGPPGSGRGAGKWWDGCGGGRAAPGARGARQGQRPPGLRDRPASCPSLVSAVPRRRGLGTTLAPSPPRQVNYCQLRAELSAPRGTHLGARVFKSRKRKVK